MIGDARVLVVGAGGGIGQAVLEQLTGQDWVGRVFATHRLPVSSAHSKVAWLPLDLAQVASIESCMSALSEQTDRLDLVLVVSGILHNTQIAPEKSLNQIDANNLMASYAVNAAAPLTLLAACKGLLKRSAAPKVLVLSAQVGSIGDNGTGGWYAYRMAKAALNMGLKCLAIEVGRWRNNPCVLSVHPGTTLTSLSKPFVARRKVPPQPAQRCASRLLELVAAVSAEDSGRFVTLDGNDLPW